MPWLDTRQRNSLEKAPYSLILVSTISTHSEDLGSLMRLPLPVGGPGNAGSQFAITYGVQMAKRIGDDWDLVGFDPRGIGNTRRVESLTSAAFFLRL